MLGSPLALPEASRQTAQENKSCESTRKRRAAGGRPKPQTQRRPPWRGSFRLRFCDPSPDTFLKSGRKRGVYLPFSEQRRKIRFVRFFRVHTSEGRRFVGLPSAQVSAASVTTHLCLCAATHCAVGADCFASIFDSAAHVQAASPACVDGDFFARYATLHRAILPVHLTRGINRSRRAAFERRSSAVAPDVSVYAVPRAVREGCGVEVLPARRADGVIGPAGHRREYYNCSQQSECSDRIHCRFSFFLWRLVKLRSHPCYAAPGENTPKIHHSRVH